MVKNFQIDPLDVTSTHSYLVSTAGNRHTIEELYHGEVKRIIKAIESERNYYNLYEKIHSISFDTHQLHDIQIP